MEIQSRINNSNHNINIFSNRNNSLNNNILFNSKNNINLPCISDNKRIFIHKPSDFTKSKYTFLGCLSNKSEILNLNSRKFFNSPKFSMKDINNQIQIENKIISSILKDETKNLPSLLLSYIPNKDSNNLKKKFIEREKISINLNDNYNSEDNKNEIMEKDLELDNSNNNNSNNLNNSNVNNSNLDNSNIDNSNINNSNIDNMSKINENTTENNIHNSIKLNHESIINNMNMHNNESIINNINLNNSKINIDNKERTNNNFFSNNFLRKKSNNKIMKNESDGVNLNRKIEKQVFINFTINRSKSNNKNTNNVKEKMSIDYKKNFHMDVTHHRVQSMFFSPKLSYKKINTKNLDYLSSYGKFKSYIF